MRFYHDSAFYAVAYVEFLEIGGRPYLGREVHCALARRGRVVHFEAHGLMDIEAKKPMTRDTLFRLASSSKPITAAAILVLMEEGKLKLTDPVAKYIPEFNNSKVAMETMRGAVPMSDQVPAGGDRYYLVPANHDITIIDLLTHTSGLATGGITNTDFQSLLKSRKPTDTLADFIPRLGALPLDFQPGTQWRYSGLAGFDTLGRIVEIASGLTFDQFLRQRLFEPLAMNNTWFNILAAAFRAKVSGMQRDVRRGHPAGVSKRRSTIPLGASALFSGFPVALHPAAERRWSSPYCLSFVWAGVSGIFEAHKACRR